MASEDKSHGSAHEPADGVPPSRPGSDEEGKSSRDPNASHRRWERQRSSVRSVTKHGKEQPRSRFERYLRSARQLASIATPLFIAIFGFWFNCATERQHEYQTAVQILNQREQSELQARSGVFDKPIVALLDKHNDLDARILALETFLYNFHSVVNARNLMTDLENEIEESGKPDLERSKRSTTLQLMAQGIANAQKQMLAAAMDDQPKVNCLHKSTADYRQGPLSTSDSPRRPPSIVKVNLEQPKSCTLSYPRRWFKDDEHTVTLSLLCVGRHTQLRSGCPHSSTPEKTDPFATSARITMTIDDSAASDPFEITKFGSPFSDNAILDHGHRIALVLRSLSATDMELEVLTFPKDLVPPGYRPTITNISRLLSGESG
jgi:hypothetical protein